MKQKSGKDGWRGFIELCANIHDKADFNKLCDLFFTIEEKETFASRYLIITALIEEKLTQREIAEKNKVSIAQITRGSNALKIIDVKLKKILCEKLKK